MTTIRAGGTEGSVGYLPRKMYIVPFAYLLSSYSKFEWAENVVRTGLHKKVEQQTNLLYNQVVSLKAR